MKKFLIKTESKMRQEGNRGPRREGGFKSFDSGPREMHKAVCSECGQECEVPFKPTEGKPVYCRSCYAKHKPQRY